MRQSFQTCQIHVFYSPWLQHPLVSPLPSLASAYSLGSGTAHSLCFFPRSFKVPMLRKEKKKKKTARWFQFCLWEHSQGDHSLLILESSLFLTFSGFCSLNSSTCFFFVHCSSVDRCWEFLVRGQEEWHLESHAEGTSWSATPIVESLGKMVEDQDEEGRQVMGFVCMLPGLNNRMTPNGFNSHTHSYTDLCTCGMYTYRQCKFSRNQSWKHWSVLAQGHNCTRDTNSPYHSVQPLLWCLPRSELHFSHRAICWRFSMFLHILFWVNQNNTYNIFLLMCHTHLCGCDSQGQGPTLSYCLSC